ncbi:MAG TPA: prephenate dehydrogenase/arogenate dehydrogenase family protein [Bacteroidales bacterium]|nr:prephenate dehydrogenase/arogenate dehydrogenase family protein [Bacteroidales bacterium]HRW33572.1 prephenate dehydrogenase/arogenate dehydrogenase family protein [Thermotogota bacterium]
MKIFILGAGKMGKWFAEELNQDHEVAIYDPDPKQMKHLYHVKRFSVLKELKEFEPEMVINCVTLNKTIIAFEEIMSLIPDSTILSDITSVKYGLKVFYQNHSHRFVSTHPMFGPTFANINDLTSENAVIIKESDEIGHSFFKAFFNSLRLNLYEYSFEDHDQIMAYSLATPFISSLVFGSCLKEKAVPGTTFKKHMHIAQNLMNEDDYLLAEILFNPYTTKQIKLIHSQLNTLTEIIEKRDFIAMKAYLDAVRKTINNT